MSYLISKQAENVEALGNIHQSLMIPKPLLLAQNSASTTQPPCGSVLAKKKYKDH